MPLILPEESVQDAVAGTMNPPPVQAAKPPELDASFLDVAAAAPEGDERGDAEHEEGHVPRVVREGAALRGQAGPTVGRDVRQ